MAITLYRRHRIACEGGHEEDSKSGEFEEGRRGWKQCACLIHASGTVGKKFSRKNTAQADWDKARAAAALWETAKSWDAAPTPAVSAPLPDGMVTLGRAIEAFKSEIRDLAPSTRRSYGFLLTALKAFAETKGFVMLEQFGPVDIREFRDAWSVGPQTSANRMSSLKAFFELGVSNEWLKRNPARLVKNRKGRDAGDTRNEQKLPFSDDELKRMYDAAHNDYGRQTVKWSREVHHKRIEGELARYTRKWTGQDLADFVSLSVYTGLRISDVATFNAAERLKSTGEVHVRTTKSRTHVYTWIPEWLQERVRARVQVHGPLIFGAHETTSIEVITDLWRRKLNKLWALCGPWQDKPTPHRFRHTFARMLLQRNGVTVRDVAELLGNSEAMVRKHYAAWIPERQERLTAILKDAFTECPRPNPAPLLMQSQGQICPEVVDAVA